MDYFVKSPDGTVFGPADTAKLRSWADDSRVTPEYVVSSDGRSWQPITSIDGLGMDYLVEMHVGEVFGPFTRKVVDDLAAKGEVPPTAHIYARENLLVAAKAETDRAKAEVEKSKAAVAAAKATADELRESRKTVASLEAANAAFQDRNARLQTTNSALEKTRASLEAEIAALKAKIAAADEARKDTIVIDPEVLDPEPVRAERIDSEPPPRVEPLNNMASLEQRLRSEILRARQKGVDFSFLRKK